MTQDGAFSGAVPSLLPQEVARLLDCEVLLPGVMDPHDDHPVETYGSFKTAVKFKLT